MERQVKERLVGAAVIVAIAVILIPELLSGPSSKDKPAVTQTRNEQGIKTYEFQLDGGGRASGGLKSSTTAPPPEQSTPTPDEVAGTPDPRTEETVATKPAAQKSVEPEAPPKPAPSSSPKPVTTPVPVEQTPAPKPKPPAREGASTPGWAVQLGSFSDEERATKLAARMEAAGHNAYIVPLRRPNGDTWQRVRIGPYPERSAAEAALARVAGEVKGAAIVTQP